LIVPLGDLIGVGGEGRVFGVTTRPGIAAKIYHDAPLADDQAQKLRAMLELDASQLAPIAAWPHDMLFDVRGKRPCGILLGRIDDARQLHELYGATARARHFPHAHWHHLVLAARNAAAAFEALHARGVVVGDVNQGNLLVDREMCVRFIDCDSFQIATDAKLFGCPVGTPHFTPPELQSVTLSQVARTPQHDAFGLAILIFHLLFVGRHPFAGRFRGEGDMHIERAIAERRFAFSHRNDETQFDPPPASLNLADLPPSMGQMFERAFRTSPGSGDQRPSPREWVLALEDLLKKRKECKIDPTHVYFGEAEGCPWCRIETAGGPSFFVNEALVGGTMQSRLEAYDRCLAQVGEIRFPDLARRTLQPPHLPPLKAPKHPPPKRRADWLAIGWAASALLSLGGAAYWPLLAAGAAGSLATTLGLRLGSGGKLRRSGNEAYLKQLDRLGDALERCGDEVLARHRARQAEFDSLAEQVNTDRGLYATGAEDMETVVQLLRAEQKNDHLGSLMIRDYRRRIPGLHRVDVAVLESYGVETALDCESHLLAGIPSVAPQVIAELLDWRDRMLEEFAFQPEAGVTENEIQIDRQEASAQFKISQARKVLSGSTILRGMALRGDTELQQDLSSFERLVAQWRGLAREYQDFQVTRTPLERLLNQSPRVLLAAGLGAPLVGGVLWWLLG
jgi:DNA-binding helix-hairpin-helix protein with protein kinase domain